MRLSLIKIRMKNTLYLLGITSATLGMACDNPFAYSYLPETTAAGRFEVEQYATWRAGRDLGTGYQSAYQGINFETEIEYGLTRCDQLTLEVNQVYLNHAAVNGLRFGGVKLGYLHRFSNAASQEWGSAVYVETGNVQVDDGDGTLTNGWSAEFKWIWQHNFGEGQAWMYAGNLIVEPTWFQGESVSTEYTLTQGLMYNLSRNWFVGIEALGVMECAGWSQHQASAIYMGPTLAYQGERCFANLGIQWQVRGAPTNQGQLNVTEFSPFQIRLKCGVQF